MDAKKSMSDLLAAFSDRNVSDLILTAGTPPQIRVNGMLQPLGNQALNGDETRQLVHSFLTREQIQRLDETRHLDMSHQFPGHGRFRISAYFQRDTIGCAFRIIVSSIPSFEDLGLPPIIRDLALRPHGLVLITGPAGSGKSTTLAAMINHINEHRHYHIVCIEDPIEYLHRHGKSTIAQREIGGDARSFAEALRSVFRQTPDVIMIGEMRDLETMQLALTLAETGHLILATLHTQDTSHSINRIVDSFPSNQQQQVYVQLSLVLQGVVSQQLIMTRDRKRRVLACEILNMNNAVRNLIRENEIQQIYSVIQTGRAEGMMTMNESLRQLVGLDLIDSDSALMRSPHPKELKRMLEHVAR